MDDPRRVTRTDRINYAQSTSETTATGRVYRNVRSARVGIQIYHDATGKPVRELRPPSQVFAPEALASMNNAPFKIGHGGDPTPRGRVVNPRRAETHVEHEIEVPAAHADAIEAAPKGLSWEYSCTLGPPDPMLADVYGEHDSVQENIRAQALSAVEFPRCGPSCSFKADCATCQAPSTKPITKGENRMGVIQIDTLQIDATATEAIQTAINRTVDELTTKLRDAEAALSAAVQGRTDAEKAMQIAVTERDRFKAELDVKLDANPTMMICPDCDETGKIDGTKCTECNGAGIIPALDPKARLDRAEKMRVARTDGAADDLKTRILAYGLLGKNRLDDVVTIPIHDLMKICIAKLQPRAKLDGANDTPGYIRSRFDSELDRVNNITPTAQALTSSVTVRDAGFDLAAENIDHMQGRTPDEARALMIERNKRAFVR